MSYYLVKGKGWRYDFTQSGKRHTEAWFKTKKEAKEAEAKKREELKNPQPPQLEVIQLEQQAEEKTTSTDITFLELVNRRLDFVKAYKSESYYKTYVILARRWVKKWGSLTCAQITRSKVENFILDRKNTSAYAANKEIKYLKATFNHGIKKGWLAENPAKGIDFLPEEKRLKYVPPPEDLDKIIDLARPDVRDYLMTIRDTMARVSEVNRLTWDDVNLDQRYVVLYTRKKKGGHLTPRKVPMTQRLYEILLKRFLQKDKSIPWVFWRRYTIRKTGEVKVGPFKDRRESFNNLKAKAEVRNFGFHALRHSGASTMDNNNVPIGSIQRILGHENRTTTEIYLHSIGDTEREAIAIYERASQNHQSGESLTQSHTQKTNRV